MSTVAVIEEQPRSVSVMDLRKSPHLLSRTGLFFKKVSPFRTSRRKSEERKTSAAYPRGTRSMDLNALGNKPFGMSQPILAVSTDQSDNEEQSDSSPTVSASPTCPPPQPAEPYRSSPHLPKPQLEAVKPNPARTNATPRIPPPNGLPPVSQVSSTPAVDGLPASDDASWVMLNNDKKQTSTMPPSKNNATSASMSTTNNTTLPLVVDEDELHESGSHDSAQTFHSAAENLPASASQPGTVSAIPDYRDKPLPSAPIELNDHPKPPATTGFTSWQLNPANPFTSMIGTRMSSPEARIQQSPRTRNSLPSGSTSAQTPASVGTSSAGSSPIPPSLHPRLASLPPPMMGLYASQGSMRMTPSIGPRPTPMPILNLPTLPLPTPRTPAPEAVTQSPARLRTMPALPLRGPSEVDEADHENAALDEMEDVDEMDEEGDGEGEGEGEGDDEMDPSEHVSDNESSTEIEVPQVGHRLRSPLPPSLSRSPRLPSVDTSPLNIHWRGSPSEDPNRPGMQFFTPTDPAPPADILRTPIPGLRKAPGAAQQNLDYFTSKKPEPHSPVLDATLTPRPGDFDGLVVPRTVPMPSASPRPSLYHQGSKSMVNLLSMTRKEDAEAAELAEKRRTRTPKMALPTTHETPQQPAAGPSNVTKVTHAEDLVKTPTLRRQRSLPMYTTATEPPPYPAFEKWQPQPPIIVPREEEGREQLPTYTNQIYLVAIMPRKLEFVAPGVQAKDRKWKRALCVLQGTTFKVYRVHGSVVEDWWERTVGVGDRTTVDPFTVGAAGTIRVSGLRGTERAVAARAERPEKEDSSPSQADIDASEAAASSSSPTSTNGNGSAAMQVNKPVSSRSKLHLAASLLHPSRANFGHKLGEPSSLAASRSSFDVPRNQPSSGAATPRRRRSMDSSRTGAATSASAAPSVMRVQRNNSSDTAPTAASSVSPSISGVSRAGSIAPATAHFGSTTSCTYPDHEPDARDLVRAYTLQHAESGLASDYIKRKNVIRVRMEGEQFLLQAKDVPAVIEWIEGIQAATNVALDLDERPMPKGPIFPRRRRRRRARTDAQGSTSAPGANAASSSSSRPTRAH